MVFKGRIPCKIRAYIKYHKQDIVRHKVGNRQLIEILAKECNITTRSVYRLLKEPITQQPKPRGGGRPRKVDGRTRSRMIRNIQKIGAEVFPIPPRSPELNPIENLFSFVKKDLRKNAIAQNIHRETYDQFSLRLKHTLLSADKGTINNIIGSYSRRLSQVIIRKGGKINY